MLKNILTSKWVYLGLIAVLIGGGYFVYANQQEPEAYVTTNPQYQDLSQTIEVSGVIDAEKRADLFFPTISRLTWVGVEQGQWVKQWQAIASVDTRTLEKQLQQDLNTFEKVWRTHDQNIDDTNYYDPSGLSDEFKRIIEKSSFDLQNAAINVEIRDLAIRLSSLISPIDGMVTRIDAADPGINISPNHIFQIINPETVYIASVIDEEDISQIKVGQTVTVVIDAYPDEEIQATITDVDFTPSQSESGGTGYKIKISLPVANQDLKYKLGMNGTATIIISQAANVLSIPLNSLIYRDNATYVETLNQGQISRVEIQTGLESDEYIQVVSGLTPDDQVIVPDQDNG